MCTEMDVLKTGWLPLCGQLFKTDEKTCVGDRELACRRRGRPEPRLTVSWLRLSKRRRVFEYLVLSTLRHTEGI